MAHRKITRREVLQGSAALGLGYWLGGPRLFARQSANEKLGVAVIGVAGQGGWNIGQLATDKNLELCNIVALCDADERRAGEAREKFPKARFYADYRRMFDQRDIDAVLIATPDHTHSPPTILALEADKHVYCEKPLTHSVFETRRVCELAARKKKLATQMGTQIHSLSNYRRVVELVKTGAIGEIREVHVWCGKSWAAEGLPEGTPPVPDGLHYDYWVGPARFRPYHPEYLPAKWRSYWDFGGGTLADMACHHIDLSHWSLDLRWPETVEAEGPPVDPYGCPKWLIVKYHYGPRKDLPPVDLTWYHGSKRPHYFDDGQLPEWGDGTLFVGSKGMLLADYHKYVLLPEEKFSDFEPPEPFIPESPGHHREWLLACKGGQPALCNFSYAGPLTETVLLGNVAYRTGEKLAWDADRANVTNTKKASHLIKPPFRSGWVV